MTDALLTGLVVALPRVSSQDDTTVPATTPDIVLRWDHGDIYAHINNDIPQDSMLPNIFNSIDPLNKYKTWFQPFFDVKRPGIAASSAAIPFSHSVNARAYISCRAAGCTMPYTPSPRSSLPRSNSSRRNPVPRSFNNIRVGVLHLFSDK